MKSVRDDQMAAEVVGVDTKKYKIFAFTLSAVLTGFAGALYAHYLVFISPDSFSNVFSTSILMMIIIGGLGSIPGSIIGAIIVALLPEILKSFSEWQLVIYGILLIVFMIFLPRGLVQVFSSLIAKARHLLNKTTVSQNKGEG
jgi:branched-chain amino acid transport system permease protein